MLPKLAVGLRYKKPIILFAILLVFMQALVAQQGYITNGSALATGGNCYTLTTAHPTGQSGSVWYQNLMSLQQDFDFTFKVNLGSNSGGADGIAFVLQPVNTGQGGTGSDLGYGGITPSLAIEYDTYQNFDRARDPQYDHIAIQKNGNSSHETFDAGSFGYKTKGTLDGPIQASNTSPNIKDGQDHTTRIVWSASAKTLSVYFDGSFRTSYTNDIIANIFGGNQNVYWGFTGATGGLTNEQKFCLVSTSFQQAVTTAPLTVDGTQENVSCNGNNDGSAAVSFTGGNPPYTFLGWSNGATTTSISNLAPGSYTATVNDARGATATKTFTITQPAALSPTISASGPTTFCQGGSVTLSAPPATSYRWSNGATTQSLPVNTTGNYIVTITNDNGCSATSAATTVTVDRIPVATASNDGPFSSGATIHLTTSVGETYAWTGPNNFTSALQNPSIPNATSVNAGIYTVTITNNSCSTTATTNVIVTTVPAGALNFDGLDDKVEIGNWFKYENFAIEMWVKPGESQQGYANIIDNNHTYNMSWVLQQSSGNPNMYVFAVSDNNNSGIAREIYFNLTPNTWQHLALVKDEVSVAVYINGVLQQTLAHTGNITYPSETFVQLGSWRPGGRYWNGSLDEVRLWSRSLCQAEIENNMTGELEGEQPGLLAYYKFNQGFANDINTGLTNLIDVSGNNVSGTLINFGFTGPTSNWIEGTVSGLAPTFVPPTAIASNNGPVWPGATIELNTEQSGSYAWTGPNNFTSTLQNPSIVAATSENAGTYTVTVSNNGCSSIASTEVVVYPAIITKNITIALDATGKALIVASDVYDGPPTNFTMSVDKTDFTGDDVVASPVEVNFTLTDGNAFSSKSAYVTVTDAISPIIHCVTPIVADNDPGKCGAVIKFSLPFANDNAQTKTATISAGCSDGEITFAVSKSYNVSSINFISAGAYADIAHGHGQNNTITVELFNSQSEEWVLIQTTHTGKGDFHFGGTSISFAPIPEVTQIRFTSTETVHCAFHFYLLAVKLNSSTIVQTDGFPPGSLFPTGTTTNTFVATDGSGNMVTCSFTVTVNDTQKPVITGTPGNIIKGNDAGMCSAIVTWTPPVAIDNCNNVVFTASHQPGSIFAVGTTTVMYTATDSKENKTSSNFTITVVDTEKPSITAPADITVNTNTGKPFATVDIGTALTGDNCKIDFVVNDHPSTDYPPGVTTVTWTVKDMHGNIGTAAQKITVRDDQAPIISGMPLPIVQTNDAGICGAFVFWLHPKAADNSNLVNLTSSHSPGSIFLPGVTTVTYTATDNFGNSSSSSFTITVTDNEGPKVNTRPRTITLVNGVATINIEDINNNSTDNCGITSITASKTTFDCTNIGTNIVTLTATDLNGNVSSSPALVTVVGEIPVSTLIPVPANTIYTGGTPSNIYIGYGPQSVTLKQTTTEDPSTNYAWTGNGSLSCTTCASPVFAPTNPGLYTFTCTTTNRFGCNTISSITICVQDIRVPGSNGSQVYVCHKTNSQPPKTVAIAVTSVDAYLTKNTADKLGACDMTPCAAPPTFAARTAVSNESNLAIIEELQGVQSIEGLLVKVSPNPTIDVFTFIVTSNSNAPVSIKVINNLGHQVDGSANVKTGVAIKLGAKLLSGSYFAEVIQEKKRKIVQLIKVNR